MRHPHHEISDLFAFFHFILKLQEYQSNLNRCNNSHQTTLQLAIKSHFRNYFLPELSSVILVVKTGHAVFSALAQNHLMTHLSVLNSIVDISVHLLYHVIVFHLLYSPQLSLFIARLL